MSEKFDLSKFYVGKLHLNEDIVDNDTIYDSFDNEAKKEMKKATEQNGAIKIKSEIKKDGVYTDTYLTVFHKMINGYLCLHNGLSFGEHHCDNLISLEKLLPKVDYNKPKEVDNEEVINLFDKLFKEKNNLYEGNSFDVNKFYAGILCLYHDELKNQKNSKFAIDYLTSNGNTKYICMGHSTKDTKCDYRYKLYKGLFMPLNDELVFLSNNQQYDFGCFNVNCGPKINGESYYIKVKPLSSTVKDFPKVKKLTIAKATEIYNKED